MFNTISFFKYLLIGTLILSSFSCRKEKTFRVRVYNPVTEEPYENVFVTIIERENKTSGFTTESSVFYEGFTDANGEVMITRKFHKNYDYLLQTGSPDGIDMCETVSKHKDRTSGVSLQLDNKDLDGSIAYVELTPCTSLKLDIDNLNCQGSGDVMRFRGLNLDVEGEYNGWSTERTGCYAYESPNYFDVPMGRQVYEWEVTRQDGSKEYYADTMYLDEGAQNVFPIQY